MENKSCEKLPYCFISSLVDALEYAGMEHTDAIRLANKMVVSEDEFE